MESYKVLFEDGKPIAPERISFCVSRFGDSYAKTVRTMILSTDRSDLNKVLFLKNCAILLANFKMTRAGPFKGIRVDKSNGKVVDHRKKLEEAWNNVGKDLIALKGFLAGAECKPRARTILLLNEGSRKKVIEELWNIFKKLLPVTMSSYSYGLVGASKILFSVLPEIALPIDNAMWLKLFKTVDYADVIRLMTEEIRKWEKITREPLEKCDENGPTTLPAVYNVMAMRVRG